MKIENTKGVKAGEETKLTGEIHAPGRYIFQVKEGDGDVQLNFNEEKDSWTYKISFQSVEARDGADEDAVGKTLTQYINVLYKGDQVNKGGEKLLYAILTHTGVQADLDAKFPGDEKYHDSKVADTIKLKLPGKFVGLQLEHRPDKENKDRVNVVVSSAFPVGSGKKSDAVVVDSGNNKDW